MSLDRYVFSFFESFLKRPFQVDDWVHQWSLHLNFLLGNFHVNDFCIKCWMSYYLYNLKRSNVTIPYGEIGASFNNSQFGLMLWGVILVVLLLSLVVLKIMWAGDNWFSSIIILLPRKPFSSTTKQILDMK